MDAPRTGQEDATLGTGVPAEFLPCPRALVGFEDRSPPSGLGWLAAGFRHCFCVLGGDRRWTLLDPLKGRIEIVNLDGCTEADLVRHLAQVGCRLLVGDRSTVGHRRRVPLRPLTCVEVVKRALDVEAAGVFTPRQLHGWLRQRHGFVEPPTDRDRRGDPSDKA